MKLYRYLIFLLLCYGMLLSSCSKDESDLKATHIGPDSLGICFPPLIPNLRNYPFVVRMSEIEEEPQGHRVPPHIFNCTVGCEGVRIEGIDTKDILSYEVYDKLGICVGLFSNEQDFISFIFPRNGLYTVGFLTTDCCFAGCAELTESICHRVDEYSSNSDKVLIFKLIRINYVSN